MRDAPLEKLRIDYETDVRGVFTWKSLSVLFNPQTLHYSHVADWSTENTSGAVSHHAQHSFDFRSTRPVELSFELLLDLSMEYTPTLSVVGGVVAELYHHLVDNGVLRDFQKRLATLTQLIKVDQELHRPPRCRLLWGESTLITGVLTSLDRKLTAFTPWGVPVRAEFSCHFKSVTSEAQRRRGELHSADVAKRRVVRQGDTLQSIAREVYGDCSLWRPIARENHISRPLQLKPGMSLLIPPLK